MNGDPTPLPEDTRLDPHVKAKWLEALRSGRYEQGSDYLYSHSDGDRYYCCLGVLGLVCGRSPDDMEDQSFLSSILAPPAYGLPYTVQRHLADMNDGVGPDSKIVPRKSFTEIADWIEANL